MAIYRMKDNKVAMSIGVLTDGKIVSIDKQSGEKTIHEGSSQEAKELRALVKQEYKGTGREVPPEFMLAFTL